MINLTLLKQDLRSLCKMLIIFAAVLAMYFGTVIYMYEPELNRSLMDMAKTMPAMMGAFGMGGSCTTLTGFLSTYLYGFLMVIIPLIFVIMAATRLVVSHTDRGSMAQLLAAPVTRSSLMLTQAAGLLISTVALIGIAAGSGILYSMIMFPGRLDMREYLFLNLGLLALQYAVAGLCFLSSCIFSETKNSLILSAGIPLLAYLIKMLANMGGDLGRLKYFTYYSLYDTSSIINDEHSAGMKLLVLFAAGCVFFLLAIKIFCRRDLHI